MMKYLFLVALAGVSTVRASDFPFEHAQRRPEASLPGAALPEEHVRRSRSIQPEEPLGGDLPFVYFRRAPRSLQPEEPEGEGAFGYFRAPRSHQLEEPEELESEGHGPLQPDALGEGPFEYFHASAEDKEDEEDASRADVRGLSRAKRSWQGGAPQFPAPGSKSSGNAGADVSRRGPNTHATVNAQHGNDRYEVGGQWSKVVRGPNKAKPEWNVHGAIKW